MGIYLGMAGQGAACTRVYTRLVACYHIALGILSVDSSGVRKMALTPLVVSKQAD